MEFQFTTTWHLNQAGALVHIYHAMIQAFMSSTGAIEMGQGTYTKIAQLASQCEFGLPFNKIKVFSTRTDKVPNTSASSCKLRALQILNGAAAINAVS